MPILNYTTTIEATKSIGEILGQIIAHGAKRIMQEYDDKRQVDSISFTIMTPTGEKGIRLPANVNGVMKALKKQGIKCDYAKARRVAWRIVKDWVEAQMAIIEAEMVSMEEVFFPYLLGEGEKTYYERYREGQQALLAGGERQ